jgi:hypothetical protein
MSRRWPWLIGGPAVAITCVVLLLLRWPSPPPAPGPAVAAHRVHDVAVPMPAPTATPSPSATPAPSPSPTAADQAVATARAFLIAYASSQPGDTPDSLRARLRPYDTDRLDAVLGQGAASSSIAPPAGGLPAVAQLAVVGLAPDGRLVVTAQVTVAGATRYVELYLSGTVAGWRVDEVAL